MTITNLIIVYFLINIFKKVTCEKSDMQLRYDACYKLVQLKRGKENDHFKDLVNDLNQKEINNILQYSLFECYQNINYYDAEELDSKQLFEIDIYQDNYRDLVNFEKWEDLIKRGDENSLQYALMDIQKAYRDIQNGDIKINRYQNKQNQRPEVIYDHMDNTIYKSSDNDRDQYNVPTDMEGDLVIFGVNFSKLSPQFKNIIGFSLIIFVFVCVIGGLKWIQKIRGQRDKNKKKKNKKEKKK